jgi:NAD-dependent SIR2 family protein deacetylase
MNIENITVLTGAGLSNMIGLPMTSGFQILMEDNRFKAISQLLKNYLQNDFNDIEKVMSVLDDSIDANNKTFQKFILETGQLLNEITISSSNQNFRVDTVVVKKYKEFKNTAEEYLLYLKESIYNELKQPDMDSAKLLYENILLHLKSIFKESAITIFTTNYDLSFEKFWATNSELSKKINIDDEIEYGFKPRNGIFVFDPIMNDDRKNNLKYYKLHGSLDWFYDEVYGCTKSGTPATPSEPNEMPILYPGFKGRPRKEPFIKLHDIFFDNLKRTDILIVLGFAFRDPYINELIKHSKNINMKYKILYFNPVALEELPKESGLHEFKQYFNSDLIYANEKIEAKEMPFGEWLGKI